MSDQCKCSYCGRSMKRKRVMDKMSWCSSFCYEMLTGRTHSSYIEGGQYNRDKDARGIFMLAIKHQRIRFPATVSVRQALETLTNGACGD